MVEAVTWVKVPVRISGVTTWMESALPLSQQTERWYPHPLTLPISVWQIMSSTLARSASFSILPVPACPPVQGPIAVPSPELLYPALSAVAKPRQASKSSSGISVRNMPPGLYRTKRVSPLRTSSQVPTSWSLNRLRTLFMADKIML